MRNRADQSWVHDRGGRCAHRGLNYQRDRACNEAEIDEVLLDENGKEKDEMHREIDRMDGCVDCKAVIEPGSPGERAYSKEDKS